VEKYQTKIYYFVMINRKRSEYMARSSALLVNINTPAICSPSCLSFWSTVLSILDCSLTLSLEVGTALAEAD